MKAAIYSRVSTEEQAKKGYSIADQIEKCKLKAKELGSEEIEWEQFIDDGYSGADPLRPGMHKLIEAVKNNEFDLVVCFDVDRWARDLFDQLAFASEVEKVARLEFVTHTRGDPNSPEDMLFFQMKGAFAQYERSKIRQRTLIGKQRKAKEGKVVVPGGWAGHPGAFGYTYNKEESQLEINEEEAEVVKYIYKLSEEEGLGIGRITTRLNEMNIPSPKGEKWHTSTVGRTLHNEVYAGIFYNFKYKTEKNENGISYKERPAEQKIPIEVPAIVSREIWEKVQRNISKNAMKTRKGRKNNYLLAGLIKCGYCGRKFYTTPHTRGPYYRCSGTRRSVTLEKCSAPMLPAQNNSKTPGLDVVVWNAVSKRLKNPDIIKTELQNQQEEYSSDKRLNVLIDELEKKRKYSKEIEKQKNELLDLRMEGILTSEELKKRLQFLSKKNQENNYDIIDLEKEIQQATTRKELPVTIDKFCNELEKKIDNLTFEKRKEIVNMLDINVTIYPERRVVIEWPFECLHVDNHTNTSKSW